jgi:peptidyl-prolyl cis-trans isomerase SurA
MEEYHDGILLFNIMEDKVWNKAISDTGGLKAYHLQHVNDYMWKERADVSVYTLKSDSLLKLTRKLAKKRAQMNWNPDDMTRMICGSDTLSCVEIADHKYEKGDLPAGSDFLWEKNFCRVTEHPGKTEILYVNRLIPPGAKAFNEVRGQVTADYQNFLDQQWIKELRNKYPVIVNDEILNQIQ